MQAVIDKSIRHSTEEYGTCMFSSHRMPGFKYSASLAAGMLFSVGLLKQLSLESMEACIKSQYNAGKPARLPNHFNRKCSVGKAACVCKFTKPYILSESLVHKPANRHVSLGGMHCANIIVHCHDCQFCKQSMVSRSLS